MYISVIGFAEKVITSVKFQATKIGITQGAVAICFSPCSGVARNWLGTDADITITEPVSWGGRDTIYRKDDKEVGDCAGVVAMKIAAAKRAKALAEADHFHVRDRKELTSGALPEEYVGNGRINWKGAIAFPIGYNTGGPCVYAGAEAMTVYVAVSGGTQDEDEKAAWAALSAIREIIAFEHDNGWMLPNFLASEEEEEEELPDNIPACTEDDKAES